MPYIITTRAPRPIPGDWVGGAVPGIATSHAVATLEEARDHAATILEGSPTWIGTTYPDNDLPRLTAQAETLATDGGTIGPLPDGTVIEVREITRQALATDAGLTDREQSWMDEPTILAAYNAR